MRVLVTGAAGFAGQHLVRVLLDRGHDVVGTYHRREPNGCDVLSDEESDAVEWVPLELRDRSSVEGAVSRAEPEAVAHLAGVSTIGATWRDPEGAMDVITLGAVRLLNALRELDVGGGIPVLLVGSSESYGVEGTRDEPLTEELPLRPVSPYGAAKVAQEMAGRALADPDRFRLVLARSFVHTGPGQRPPFVLPDWSTQLLEVRDGGRPPVLEVGNLDVTRDITDVRDTVSAYADLVECGEARDAYNVCSGTAYTLRDLLELLQELIGVTVDVTTDPERLRDVELQSLVGSGSRIERDTGWRPEYRIRHTLRDLVHDLETRTGVPAGGS